MNENNIQNPAVIIWSGEGMRLPSDVPAIEDTPETRKILGQFATPLLLAEAMASETMHMFEKDPKFQSNRYIRFLEPSVGSGNLVEGLLDYLPGRCHFEGLGIDIDSRFCRKAKALESNWMDVTFTVQKGDFLTMKPDIDKKYNLLIANPPYTRYQSIDKNYRDKLRKEIQEELNISLSGQASLWAYFILKAHSWLEDGALSCWLLPQELLTTNYSREIREYLLHTVNLMRIHLFDLDEYVFDGVRTSACLIWFKKEKPDKTQKIRMTLGNRPQDSQYENWIEREELEGHSKWNEIYDWFPGWYEADLPESADEYTHTLGDFFDIKRGIATGWNEFFILSQDEIDNKGFDTNYFRPILPGPRKLPDNIIHPDFDGNPILLENYYVLDCDLEEEDLYWDDPILYKYIQSGKETAMTKSLCKRRRLWYKQEEREAPKFLFSYMSCKNKDGSSYRFVWNQSDAIAPNSWLLLYPKPELEYELEDNFEKENAVWRILNSLPARFFVEQGRVYGGGLRKIEPKELAKVPCPDLLNL